MRKTSQDGGDSTSATSGVESENKKPKAGLLLEFKSKKIGKRTAPNLSEESDDAVVEPLLQKTTDKTTQSAKYFAKAKADTVKEISKLFNDKKTQYATTSSFGTTETLLSDKDQAVTKTKPNPSSNAPLHNHMNTNIFHSQDSSEVNGSGKSQLLVEIDGCKQSGYNPSSLIFTTAKIHTDGKSKHMEPVQMTPAPILSTVEVSVTKGGNITTTNDKKVSNGTSVMNTSYSQAPANEKIKENIVNIPNSNVTPVTQSKQITNVDKTINTNKTVTAKANSPAGISVLTEKTKESTAISSNSNKIPSLAQNNVVNEKSYPNKSLSTLSNKASEIRSVSETSKAVTVDAKKNIIKDTKILTNEPRIIMSESKLKSTVSNNTNNVASVNIAKPSIESTKVSESSMKQTQINQSAKDDKHKSEKNNVSVDKDPNINRVDPIDSKQVQNKNVKSPIAPNDLPIISNTNTTNSLTLQKNTPAQISVVPLKTETKTISKNLECSTDPSAKTSNKTPTQSNLIDSKLGKEIDKSPKPSAKEITKTISKVSLNNTATSSANKTPTSASLEKPAQSVSSPNSSSRITTTDTSKKTISDSSVSNSKAISSMAPTSASATTSSSAITTQSLITKAATSTVNTKATSVTSTKSSTKPSSASSIKSPNSSTTKQPNTSIAKTVSGKPPPLAFTKTPQVNISSPNATTPASKPTVSKIAQVSTSNPVGQKGRPVAASSTTADSSNKTKAPESNKKGGSKLSDHTIDTKVSKA